MADYEQETKARIIDSVIKRRNAAGESQEEVYVAHLKIWEAENGQDKLRYIILSAVNGGYPILHKSRVNPNGTFSVGKTWKLADLRAIEINAVQQPLEILISFARTYTWQTESLKDQERFLSTLVSLFFEAFGPNAPLQISGFNPSNPSRIQSRSDLRSVKSVATIKDSRALPAQPNGSSTLRSRSRPPQSNGRPMSPDPIPTVRSGSPLQNGSRLVTSRPSSPALSAASAPYARKRRPSNATNSSSISYDSTGRIPSIVAPRSTASPAPPAPNRIKEPSPLRPKPLQSDGLSQIDAATRTSLDRPSASSSISSTAAGSSLLSVVTSVGSSTVIANPQFSPISSYAPEPALETGGRQRGPSRTASPAPSSNSKRSQRSRREAPSPEPSLPSAPRINRLPSSGQAIRKEANTRISFFDPVNQAALDRLLFASAIASGNQTAVPDANGDTTVQQSGDPDDIEWEEGDTVAATLTNIEEMLEGYEWIGNGRSTWSNKGDGEHIESRLLDELLLLERANIHSLLESDDSRIAKVLAGLEEAITELNSMDKTISSYKIHLNAVSDDIAFIQSQNRGLQVQTQNQQLLLNELEKLLQTVDVSRQSLLTLTQESLEKDEGIANLEMAVSELYKALLAGRDNDMAATMERLEEYRSYNSQFCQRILDFLSIMFTAQGNLLLGDSNGLATPGDRSRPILINHQRVEIYLGRYCGLMLYLKEMDETKYSRICAAYFSAASELHSKQTKALLNSYSRLIRYATDEELEQAFALSSTKDSLVPGGLRRAGTVTRTDGKREKGRKPGVGLRPFEVLDTVLEQLGPHVARERAFIADFLLINDATITFADYLSLDHYFRRQAAQYTGLSNTTLKLVRNAMDLIFGFLPAELKTFVDEALSRDETQVAGAAASIERAISDSDANSNSFFTSILEKQHQRLRMIFDRHVDKQIKGIEETRLDSKKRSGVAHFIRYFPTYVSRIESQLVGTEGLEIRSIADSAYDRIVQAMFSSLKQMAKDGEQGEDKGQLNYHVILIENMYYFIGETRQMKISAADLFMRQAETIYNENLSAYVRLVLRRPFAKIIDYFEGVERVLKTTSPTEISKNSSYSRSMLKRVVKDFDAKDIRKSIDALFKRVEKHFTDEGSETASTGNASAVMAGVWKACEDEMLRMTDSFQGIIAQCYKDTGVSLDYSKSDVEGAFRRHKLANA